MLNIYRKRLLQNEEAANGYVKSVGQSCAEGVKNL